MQSGVFWGYVALIEGLIDRIRAEYGPSDAGDRHRRRGPPSSKARPRRSTPSIPKLTLRGLLEITRRNGNLRTR